MAEANKVNPQEDPPPYGDTRSSENESRVSSGPALGIVSKPAMRAPLPLELPALTSLRGRRVILASASPRRRQLLAQIGITQIEVVPSTFAENLPKDGPPLAYVLETATQKAMQVYAQEVANATKEEPALVIAADTIIVAGGSGQILEKPTSVKHHVEMLKHLRDVGSHSVFTAVVCMTPMESAAPPGYRLESHVEETIVKFDPQVTNDLILSYVRTREGVDKAGGYGIQGIGAVLVERIEGSYDNVVGLPLRSTLKLIEKVLTIADEDEEEADVTDPEE